MKLRISFLAVFSLVIAFQLNAQIRHGQVIPSFVVYEQTSAVSQVFPGAGLLTPNEDQLYVGHCSFYRGNATTNNWKSYTEAFPLFTLMSPYFVLDKFPKIINHTAEDDVSSAHPELIIDKSRVGVAKFYFGPDPPEFFGGLPVIPAPTDVLDMTISTVSPRVAFVDNISDRTGLPAMAGHTSYDIRVRFDAPNKTTRDDAVHFGLMRARLAFYGKQDDGGWSDPIEVIVNQDSVGYMTKSIHFPNDWAKVGKFELKVELQRQIWTEPIGELAQWGPFTKTKVAGPNTSFIEILQKDDGVVGE